MDGLGQSSNGRSGDHEENGVVNGHSWAHNWSSAGAALEPSAEPLPSLQSIQPATVDHHDDSLTTTLVRPPHFVPFSMAEDPYADELAQRSAEFARHAAFDDPTPPQGLPSLPPRWGTGANSSGDTGDDPPLAASLSLGQRFELAFAEELEDGEEEPEDTQALAAAGPSPRLDSLAQPETAVDHAGLNDHAVAEEDTALPQRVPSEPDVPENAEPTDDVPVAGDPQLTRIVSGLRRPDDFHPAERPAGFDTDAVLSAVRAVAGVREAIMRTTPSGAHHLRLELAEGADPATISRMVARMLQEQMGIDAALAGDAPARIPGQAVAHDTESSMPSMPTVPSLPSMPTVPTLPPPLPVNLPGPRVGTGAVPPSASFEQRPPAFEQRPPAEAPPRESRRRHPVSVPRRQPSEVRPVDRPTASWRSTLDADQPSGAAPPPLHTEREQGPRAIIEHVQTSTFGLDATVEVRLTSGDRQASGVASGPAVDAYVLRLCAAATAAAVDDLLRDGTSTGESGRCFVEHAAIVPMGSCDVAVVVVLLVCGGWVEQLAGSALVSGDPRRAVVRATLGAVNRRLAALLPGGA